MTHTTHRPAPHSRPTAASTGSSGGRPAGAAGPPPAVGQAVNALSNAANPRSQYPAHVNFLMRDLYDRGLIPEEWQIVAADEVHLDEDGMTVEFTVLQRQENLMHRIAIDVAGAKLVSIRR